MNLSDHFTAAELNYSTATSEAVRANLRALAGLLERVRLLGGSQPLVVTSGYRPGDARQHGTGSAADIRVPNRDPIAWGNRVIPQLSSSDFGQIILYPYTTRHAHIALPNGNNRGDVRVETGKGVYTSWRPGTPVPPWGASGGARDASSPTNEGAASLEGLAMLLLSAAFTYWIFGGR
jgi:hypothetical protein